MVYIRTANSIMLCNSRVWVHAAWTIRNELVGDGAPHYQYHKAICPRIRMLNPSQPCLVVTDLTLTLPANCGQLQLGTASSRQAARV